MESSYKWLVFSNLNYDLTTKCHRLYLLDLISFAEVGEGISVHLEAVSESETPLTYNLEAYLLFNESWTRERVEEYFLNDVPIGGYVKFRPTLVRKHRASEALNLIDVPIQFGDAESERPLLQYNSESEDVEDE